MKKLLGLLLLFLSLVAWSQPAPIQRNIFSTTIPGQPVVGSFSLSNRLVNFGTNFVYVDWSGIYSPDSSGGGWKLSGGFDNSYFKYGPSLGSLLLTNGGILLSLENPNAIPLEISGYGFQIANLFQVESNGVAVVTVSASGVVMITNLLPSRVVVSSPSNTLISATGTADATTFLRGDNTYAVPSASIFNQTADGLACSNITTTFTSVLGAGVGSLTLPAGYWQVGKSVRGEFYGSYWTGAAPLQTYVVVKLGSLIVCSNLFVPTANMVGKPWFGDFMITCRTNSATVGAFVAIGKINFPSAAAFLSQQFTNLLTITDSTVAMTVDLQATNGATTTGIVTYQGGLTPR